MIVNNLLIYLLEGVNMKNYFEINEYNWAH